MTPNELTPDLAAFIEAQTSIFLATASANGQPHNRTAHRRLTRTKYQIHPALGRRSEIALSREDSDQKITPPALSSPRRLRAILLDRVLSYCYSRQKFLNRVGDNSVYRTVCWIWKSAEVDHRVPLFRVWSEHRDLPWPKLLDFWGLLNLQVINRDVHAAKCALEARDRRDTRSLETELTSSPAPHV